MEINHKRPRLFAHPHRIGQESKQFGFGLLMQIFITLVAHITHAIIDHRTERFHEIVGQAKGVGSIVVVQPESGQ